MVEISETPAVWNKRDSVSRSVAANSLKEENRGIFFRKNMR
jgi:hypothetical protein